MCGIFGTFVQSGQPDEGLLEKAARCMAHRGPDDSGTVVIAMPSGGWLGLAHRRLSIIDLSPLGHQPMHDRATGNWIVFNGEIYNFRELRAELVSEGHRFETQSDTEVVLAAYRAWGEGAFARLRGMFALGLWDAPRQILLLARDPLGIKPLYYFHNGGNFAFASEIRTLLQTGFAPRKLDPNGLLSYLEFGSVYEPWTIIDNVRSVPAGSIISFAGSKLSVREYWNPLSATDRAGGESESSGYSRQSLRRALREAVLSHLVSDVPVGVFLSGGIDSSSLVAVMSQAGVRPATFSLVFREEEFNEAEHSRKIAHRFATDHHEILVSEQDALAAMPEALGAMDQPTMDGINTWFVSARTRAAGVKVALTGLGADEMFAGYSNFRRVPQMELAAGPLRTLPAFVRLPVAGALAALGARNDRTRKLAEIASGERERLHPYFLARSLFTSAERKSLYAGDYETAESAVHGVLDESLTATRSLDPVNRVSYLESTWYMRNTLLRDSDFMSMAHGLELRVPFLEPTLVEACFRIPGKEKLRGKLPKPLLLRSLGVELPREIVNRPKRGFTLPLERWMRAELKPQVESAFQGGALNGAGVDSGAAAGVWDRFLAGETSWSRPWSLYVLGHWCERNL